MRELIMKVQSALIVSDGFTSVQMNIEGNVDFYDDGNGSKVMSVSRAVIKGPWYFFDTDMDIDKFANESFRKLAIGVLVRDAISMNRDLERGPFGPTIEPDEEPAYRTPSVPDTTRMNAEARERFEAQR